MNKVRTNITINPKVKKLSTKLLNDMGLDLSTYVELSLRAMIREQGLPFEISMEGLNKKTINAIKETVAMQAYPENAKQYNSMDELLKDLYD